MPALRRVRAKGGPRLYGEPIPGFIASNSVLVKGESETIVAASVLLIFTADTNSPVGTYAITVSGQTAPNYTINYVPGTLTVLPAPLLVKADDKSRAYGATNPIFTASYGGFVNGESNSVLGGTLAFSTTADT